MYSSSIISKNFNFFFKVDVISTIVLIFQICLLLITVAYAVEDKADDKNVKKRGLLGLGYGYGGYGAHGLGVHGLSAHGLGAHGLGVHGVVDGGWAHGLDHHTTVLTKTVAVPHAVPVHVPVHVPVDRPYPVKVSDH